MPRTPKINQEILDIFKNLLKEQNLLLACTDEDMVMMLNDNLFVEHRISYRTFQRYKRRAIREENIPDADPLYIDLLHMLRKAYVKLRQQLLTAIIDDHVGAKRFMWILERKFKEWNLRWSAPAEKQVAEEAEDNTDEPIKENEDRYPTLIGSYCDKDNPERPKDIMPVHYAVFNKYVIPNPEYDGDEDDNTREIKRMWDFLQKMNAEAAEEERTREQRILENQQRRAEQ
jgi:hypothetical protein